MDKSLAQQTNERPSGFVRSHKEADGQPVCRFCGATTDLWVEPRYVGGHGYVLTTECRLIPACRARQEQAA